MGGKWLKRFHATGWKGAATVEVGDLGKLYGGRVYLFSDDAVCPAPSLTLKLQKAEILYGLLPRCNRSTH
jgi:hypothetical protein